MVNKCACFFSEKLDEAANETLLHGKYFPYLNEREDGMQGKVEICGVNTSQLKTLSGAEMAELIHRCKQGDAQARSAETNDLPTPSLPLTTPTTFSIRLIS